MKIFITRKIPEAGLARLRGSFEIDIWEDVMPPPRQAILERVKGCAGLLSLLSDTIDGQVMDAAGPTLRAIANFAVGYNNIDVAAAKARGIQVGNTPEVLTEATADVAVGLLIAAARRFQESIDQVRALEWKTWEPLGLIGQDLDGKTLGIVGMGRIGQAVARRLHGGWGMRVLYTARSAKPEIDTAMGSRHVPFEELLRESDFISVHTDLNPSTRHMFNVDAFQKMKPTAVLVNTSRGGTIDQEALAWALREHRIFAAGLDVTDPEPLPDDSPLRNFPSCIIVPHIGSATTQARNTMAIRAAENLLAALDGRSMPYPVN